MPLPFQGMMGRVLAQTLLKQQEQRNAQKLASQVYKGRFQSSGKYLFVAHPNCCERCKLLGMTPHFYNTPDVAFITHPNCLCATIEAPAGLSPAQLIEWAQNPVGQLRFGFNYGQSLRPLNVTNENRDAMYKAWHDRMSPAGRAEHKRRLIRAKVTQEAVDNIRARVKAGELGPATDLTGKIEGLVKAARTRQLGKKKPTEVERPKVTPKKKHQMEASQKRAKSKIEEPATAKRRSAVIPRYTGEEKKNLKLGGGSFVLGSRMRTLARRRIAEEKKRRREREKELRQRGFI